jgi:hypothetical protein
MVHKTFSYWLNNWRTCSVKVTVHDFGGTGIEVCFYPMN